MPSIEIYYKIIKMYSLNRDIIINCYFVKYISWFIDDFIIKYA